MGGADRRRRYWLWGGGAAAVVVVAAGVLVLSAREREAERGPERTAYPDYSAMLKFYPPQEGLRMPTPVELKRMAKVWPTVAPEENAAFYYMKAASFMMSTGEPDGSASSGSSYQGDMAALDAWVAANAPVIEPLREGVARTVCMFPPFVVKQGCPPEFVRHSSALRNVVRIVADAGFAAEIRGEPEKAAEFYRLCLPFGRHVRQGVMIDSLVGLAICSRGIAGLERLVAGSNLSEESLRAIIEACRAATPGPMEASEALKRECDNMVARSDGSVAARVLLLSEKSSLEDAAQLFARPLPQLMKERGACAHFDGTSKEKGRVASHLWRFKSGLVELEFQLRAMEARAALALYKARKGEFPERLDALAPDILKALPVDPFTGGPLRYARTPEGWRLWSVGPDLKDDGGQPGLQFVDEERWRGADWVFSSSRLSAFDRMAQRQKVDLPAPPSGPPGSPQSTLPPTPSANSDPLGLTPLHYAANRGDKAVVDALIAQGADVNARGFAKQTPLHLAVNREVADLLLSKGAEVDARDRWDRTPLFWAAGAGRKDVAEALLARGAKPDAVETPDRFTMAFSDAIRAQLSQKYGLTIPPGAPRTPVMRAYEQGHQDIADVIQQKVK